MWKNSILPILLEEQWLSFLTVLFCCVALLKVEVYELLDGRSNPQKKNLIASRLLSLYSEGWEVFNVTQTVSREHLVIFTSKISVMAVLS